MSSESLFCRDCGALLDVSRSTASKIGCIRCSFSVPLNEYCASYTRISSSRAKIDYNALYSKLSAGEARASVNETCPKCQHGVAWFKSVQMRSADEGETVFYECQVKQWQPLAYLFLFVDAWRQACAHKWSQNN
jgi:DNA-directed RNA polymerase subunit M/transcription elongation factor TFIIS